MMTQEYDFQAEKNLVSGSEKVELPSSNKINRRFIFVKGILIMMTEAFQSAEFIVDCVAIASRD